MVKRPTHNRLSLGSIPSWPTIHICCTVNIEVDRRVNSCYNSNIESLIAPLAELVDAADLGSVIERCESSSLLGGTNFNIKGKYAYKD